MIGKAAFYAEEAPGELAAMMQAMESASLADAMQECAEIGKQAMQDNFNSQASPDNIDFLPRKRADGGHPILNKSGAMRQAATGGGSGHIEQVGERDVALGVDGSVIPYAATQNFGRDWGRGAPIPQREYAGLHQQAEDACEDAITNAVMREVF